MARIITITANPLLDQLAHVAIAPGKSVRVPAIGFIAGGKGINVARVLSRHGHAVVALGFAGGATGAIYTDLVEADGIETGFTPTKARLRIGWMAVDPDRGGSTAVLEGGFAVRASESADLLRRLRRHLDHADMVIAGGSVPDPSCDDLYRLIASACHRAGVPFWLDAYGEAMERALDGPHPPALVKPNRQEYGRGGRRWAQPAELHLSDGAAEVRVRTPTGRFRVVPPPVREVNPVGSGDCYLAALAHARLSGADLPAQLRYAAAAGAANAARADIARIGPEDITPLESAVQVVPAG